MTKENEIIQLARSQIGTCEQPADSNNVKYNTWYYGQPVSGAAYPWCMVFVEWVFTNADQTLGFMTASCSGLLEWYRSHKPRCVKSEPMPGDVVIYDFGHCGIVTEDLGETIAAVEGNTSVTSDDNGGCVLERIRKKSSVTAYIRPYPEDVTSAAKQWAIDNDLIIGTSSSSWVPEWDRAITREEAVILLYRYHKMMEGIVSI